ncbi:HAD-IG family 5'-nucleotidase [Rubrivirga sp. IMCC45206]|uniref:HAD-IG family 5'-nucleotidase n=1 Tax=Rubrivirga sp. IMCC45206 TaxID=3391614 RepID=UPI00398F93A6
MEATIGAGTHGAHGVPDAFDHPRGLFCNRTLNLRKIGAVGYDMDYTLVHYHVALWEERAHAYIKNGLAKEGWPVDDLVFDPDLVVQGLVVDTERGNVVKANRFGYVKRAFHGTRPLPFDEQRQAYRRTLVDLHDRRWRFMNTLFSISEASIYLQLVDKLDAGELPDRIGYDDLYEAVRHALDAAHLEGLLKAEILADPARFVDVDPEVPLALLDQKLAGKKVLLITNSEWTYAAPLLAYAFDPHLPGDMTWRDLFDLAIVGARKPAFFDQQAPAFEVVGEDEEGRAVLRTVNGVLEEGRAYVGGNAALVEASLGLRGSEILYVGDHVYADVKASKSVLRWRTALVLRPLEDEIAAFDAWRGQQARLTAMMAEKERLEAYFSALRLERQRNAEGYGPQTDRSLDWLDARMAEARERLLVLDAAIGPLAVESSQLVNPRWGPLMWAGNDKSHLARQIEASADVYTARVSNFLHYTPFVYLRSPRGSLPHDLATPQDRGLEAAAHDLGVEDFGPDDGREPPGGDGLSPESAAR